jgi:hypothetical protein
MTQTTTPAPEWKELTTTYRNDFRNATNSASALDSYVHLKITEMVKEKTNSASC